MKTFLIAAAALVVGMVLGALSREPTVRSLQRQVRKLRSAVKSSGNPAVDRLSTHEKALYYKMLDDIESGGTCGLSRNRQENKSILRSVTRFLFVTTQVFAIIWVTWTYGIATYSTIVLLQPFPVEELSRQSIITLLGMGGLKVLENIFEHNEGAVFGRNSVAEYAVPTEPSDPASEDDAPAG